MYRTASIRLGGQVVAEMNNALVGISGVTIGDGRLRRPAMAQHFVTQLSDSRFRRPLDPDRVARVTALIARNGGLSTGLAGPDPATPAAGQHRLPKGDAPPPA
jgi:hypothetical protein